MVPVGLKAKEAHVASAEGGNAVGSIMVKLATELARPGGAPEDDPHDMRAGKEALSWMTPTQIVAMSALGQRRRSSRRCCGCRASPARRTTW